jgi:hypothetical protein
MNIPRQQGCQIENTRALPVRGFVDAIDLDRSIDMLALRFESGEVSANAVRKMVFESPKDSFYEFLRNFASMFPRSILAVDRNIFEIVTIGMNAWNTYPHLDMQGMSPQEITYKEIEKVAP